MIGYGEWAQVSKRFACEPYDAIYHNFVTAHPAMKVGYKAFVQCKPLEVYSQAVCPKQ
jgi:hypothetical protein